MKHRFTLTLLAAASLSLSALAQDFTVSGIKYSVLPGDSKTCQLTDGKKTNITVR